MKSEQVARSWTDVELHRRSGIPRATFNNLETGSRRPTARVITALAEALDIDVTEAHELAGLLPRTTRTTPAVSVRDAIAADPLYTDEQRRIMLDLVDLIDQANAGRTDQRRAG